MLPHSLGDTPRGATTPLVTPLSPQTCYLSRSLLYLADIVVGTERPRDEQRVGANPRGMLGGPHNPLPRPLFPRRDIYRSSAPSWSSTLGRGCVRTWGSSTAPS